MKKRYPMALAVTHVILTIIILDLIRHYVIGKKLFPRYLVLIGGISSLLPDSDIIIGWIYQLFTGIEVAFHGGPTHSVLFPAIFLCLGIYLHASKKVGLAQICYIVSFAWFFHLCLDCLFGGMKSYLWPLVSYEFCPEFYLQSHAPEIDAILLIFWLVHEELAHKIEDYF